jgi:hypothetical protein
MRVDARQETALPVEEIIARDPASALYLPHAERLVEDGRLDEAIALCEDRRHRPGRGVGDHIVLGRAYLADGQLGLARAEFQSALELDRENVVALKALGGILAHEGHHVEAGSYYQAVCRVDPGDLESQTALHQITSGEFPEIRPADVIVGQGGLTWQPVRLPREEEHLSELALGLRTIERFEGLETAIRSAGMEPPAASASAPTAPAASAPAAWTELPVERIAPPPEPVRPAPDPIEDAWMPIVEPPAPSREFEPTTTPPERADAGPTGTASEAEHPEAGRETSPTTPARGALGDIVEQHPPVEVPRPVPGQVVEGNKSAFQTWLRQLSGRG